MVKITKIKKETTKVSRIVYSRKVTENEAKDLIIFSNEEKVYFLIKENKNVLDGEKYLNKVFV